MFTTTEEKIMNHLRDAHNLYVSLDDPRREEWVNSLHDLQRIVSMRILRRDYPDYFNTPKKQ